MGRNNRKPQPPVVSSEALPAAAAQEAPTASARETKEESRENWKGGAGEPASPPDAAATPARPPPPNPADNRCSSTEKRLADRSKFEESRASVADLPLVAPGGLSLTSFTTTVAGLSFGDTGRRRTVRCDVLETHAGLTDALRKERGSSVFDRLALDFGVKDVLIMHPGNPGVVHFYDTFILALHRRQPDLAVMVLGFAGHSLSDGVNGAAVFDLQDQVEAADAFYRKVVGPNTAAVNATNNGYSAGPRSGCRGLRHVFSAGHSIGAHVSLHMTARHEAFVTKGLLLTPTITRMRQSPNGIRNAMFLTAPVIWLAAFVLAAALAKLPRPVKRLLVRAAEPHMNAVHQHTVEAMPRTPLVRNILSLAKTEFAQVAELDVPLLQAQRDRVWLYFVHGDGWVPLADMGRMRAAVPGLDCLLDTDRSVKHAWCIAAADKVAAQMHREVLGHYAVS